MPMITPGREIMKNLNNITTNKCNATEATMRTFKGL